MLHHKNRIWLIALLYVACKSAPPPAPTPVAPRPVPPKPKAEKKEVPSIFEKADTYSFDPFGKRDPFLVYTEEAVTEDSSIPKTPLERYNVDQLKVTAIVWGISDPRAMILAPDNKNYIVRTNTRIGKNRGRIAKITKQSVFVEEEYRDPSGKLNVNELEMQIRPPVKSKTEEELKLKMVED